MDFVIFGMGLGATLVVLGWLWRTLGPRLRHQPGSEALLSGEQMVERISWTRFCRSGGFVWIMGGCLLLFAALASLVLHLSDHTGALTVLAAFGVVALGVIAWLGAYLRRFGLIGLVAPRPAPATTPAPVPTAPPARPAARPVLRRKQPQPATAAAAPVEGPAVPTLVAAPAVEGPPVPETLTATNETAPEGETAAQQNEALADAPAPASAEAAESRAAESAGTAAAPTFIGAERRNEQPAGSRSEPAAAADEPAVPAAEAATGQPSKTPGDETAAGSAEADQPDQTAKLSSLPAETSSGPADGESANDKRDEASPEPSAKRQVAGSSNPTGERRFSSAAFQEAIARQEANLARAAGDRVVATQQPAQAPSPVNTDAGSRQSGEAGASDAQRRFPAPRGAEGVHWVRGDGSARIPGGFPVKGDPATRQYYPATAENYAQVTARYFFATARDAENAGYRQASPPHRVASAPDRRQTTPRPHANPRPEVDVPVPAGIEGRDWVRGDGTAMVPAGFPIKGNAGSKLYHPVGSRFYDRTIAEYYFAGTEQAKAAGYHLPRALRESSESTTARVPSPRSPQRAPSQPQADHDSR